MRTAGTEAWLGTRILHACHKLLSFFECGLRFGWLWQGVCQLALQPVAPDGLTRLRSNVGMTLRSDSSLGVSPTGNAE